MGHRFFRHAPYLFLASFLVRKIGKFLICTLDKGQCKAEVNFLGIIFGIWGSSGQSLSLTYLSI